MLICFEPQLLIFGCTFLLLFDTLQTVGDYFALFVISHNFIFTVSNQKLCTHQVGDFYPLSHNLQKIFYNWFTVRIRKCDYMTPKNNIYQQQVI